jgi:putative flippase GtrA
MHKHRRRLLEAGRFLAVGGVATVVALFLFNLLVHGYRRGGEAPLAQHVLVAYVVANTVGMIVSYRGTRSWAFRDRPPVQADGGRLAFLLINALTMALPVGCLAFSRNVLGLDDPISDNLSANVVGLFLGLVSRFYLFRVVIFRSPPPLPHLHEHGRHELEPEHGPREEREPGVRTAAAPRAPSTCAPARPPAP